MLATIIDIIQDPWLYPKFQTMSLQVAIYLIAGFVGYWLLKQD